MRRPAAAAAPLHVDDEQRDGRLDAAAHDLAQQLALVAARRSTSHSRRGVCTRDVVVPSLPARAIARLLVKPAHEQGLALPGGAGEAQRRRRGQRIACDRELPGTGKRVRDGVARTKHEHDFISRGRVPRVGGMSDSGVPQAARPGCAARANVRPGAA